MKLYIGLSWAAIICLFLSGALHSISLFVEPAASNEIANQPSLPGSSDVLLKAN